MLKRILVTAACLAAMPAVAQETVAITNATLHMTSPSGDVIEGGTLILRGGRIAAVGENLPLPQNARTIDAQGQPVTPGFFVPVSAIGLTEIGADRESNDAATRGEPTITASLSAADGFNADTSVIDITRAGGITRAYVTTGSGDSIFGGCGMVIAMKRGEDAITEPCVAQSVTLGGAGARQHGGSRPGAFAAFRRALEDAASYRDDPEAYAGRDLGDRLSAGDARALLPVIDGDRKLMVGVESISDIRRVLDLGEEYGLDLILVGASGAWRLGDAIADAGIPVITTPLLNLPASFETMASDEAAPSRLAEAGVEISFFDPGTGFTHNARLLPQLAGNAVAAGLPYEEAMRAVTLAPAAMFGLDRQLGSLERGKLADVVIWNGDPFELSSRPVRVFIEGEEMSLENRQSRLARRYLDLSGRELPVQYRRD